MMTTEEIQEVLQAFKEGKLLQYKGITSRWEDSTMNLASLLGWLSYGRMVRIAPPKPRTIYQIEVDAYAGSKLRGLVGYFDCFWTADAYIKGAASKLNPKLITFVEKMD